MTDRITKALYLAFNNGAADGEAVAAFGTARRLMAQQGVGIETILQGETADHVTRSSSLRNIPAEYVLHFTSRISEVAFEAEVLFSFMHETDRGVVHLDLDFTGKEEHVAGIIDWIEDIVAAMNG